MTVFAFSSGLQGHLRSCLTILDSSRRLLSKNVRHDLVRPRRPELEAEMSVFNLAQKRSFPPLCNGTKILLDLFVTGRNQSIASCEARGAAEPRRKLTNFMVPNLSEQFGWYGALAERAEGPSLATKIITKGRFGLLAAFSGLVDQKYNLQDYCLFVFTRHSGTRDRLLLKLFPLPHCVLVQNVACYINSSRHSHTLLQVWARIHEGSHSSHASPWPLRPKVNILLTTCQTYCPVEVWHMRVPGLVHVSRLRTGRIFSLFWLKFCSKARSIYAFF
jgi:hypothetical protein